MTMVMVELKKTSEVITVEKNKVMGQKGKAKSQGIIKLQVS